MSCYSDFVLQCLLQCHVLRVSLHLHCRKLTLLTLSVRTAVDDQFSIAQQQDVGEFFIKLADVFTDVDIETLLYKHTMGLSLLFM